MKGGIFYSAVITFVGAGIGAGIFGLPYVFFEAGWFWSIFWLIVVTTLLSLTYLVHAKFSLKSPDNLRLVGIGESYLPKWISRFNAFVIIAHLLGISIAYVILGGLFTRNLAILINPDLAVFWWPTFYTLIISLTLFGNIKAIKKIQGPLSYVLLATILILLVYIFPKFDSTVIANSYDFNFRPYGVLLFALSSLSAVPIIEELVGKKKKFFIPAMMIGSLLISFFSMFFGFVVAGVTGEATTQASMDGLSVMYGGGIIVLGSVIGLLAVITSHISAGITLNEIFKLDYKLNSFVSWLLAAWVPFLIYKVSTAGFIDVIEFIGAVIGGLFGIFVGMIGYVFSRREKNMALYTFLSILIIIAYIVGIVLHFI